MLAPEDDTKRRQTMIDREGCRFRKLLRCKTLIDSEKRRGLLSSHAHSTGLCHPSTPCLQVLSLARSFFRLTFTPCFARVSRVTGENTPQRRAERCKEQVPETRGRR